jgi:GNAT superfamily N-acetyltransferase
MTCPPLDDKRHLSCPMWPSHTDTVISIRRVRPADAPALDEFYAGLSADSRHARFLGTVRRLGDGQAASFCQPDHMHAEGFVAISERAADRGAVLGHLCLEPASAGRLEVAVAVADRLQGRGIGRALFRAALDWATARGYRALVASCFADNSRVLSLLSSAPYAAKVLPADGGLVDVVVPLRAPVPADWSIAPSLIASPRQAAHPHGRAHTGACRTIWRVH